MAEVIVMHKTGIQLDTAGEGQYVPFRWRGEIADEEYQACCALDEAAGRDHRLMRIDAPEPKVEAEAAPELKTRRRGRPPKVQPDGDGDAAA